MVNFGKLGRKFLPFEKRDKAKNTTMKINFGACFTEYSTVWQNIHFHIESIMKCLTTKKPKGNEWKLIVYF